MIKYDSTANGYDELYRDEQWEKYDVAKKTLLDKQLTILCDFGSGTLLFLEYITSTSLSQRVSYYVALELSYKMIVNSMKRAKKLSKSHLVDVVQADIENTPLRDSSCSIAVSYTVLDLVDNPMQVLEEIKRTSSYAVVSLLKKAQRLKTMSLRIGTYIGETDKDVLFQLKGKIHSKS
jgi:ubiquinone/menaquinone biosynthesis C-methylase UbiE